MDDSLSIEREFSLEHAENRALHVLQEWGYEAQLRAIHEGPWAVWQCEISRDGRPVPSAPGAGKGVSECARLGALCEAIEHLITDTNAATSGVTLGRAGDVAANVAGVAEPLLTEQADASLACAEYAPMIDGETVSIPVGMSVPAYARDPRLGDTFDYSVLVPYVSNSGTAIGTTSREAQLHGLNEAIERDALSVLLCRAFLGAGYQPTLIDPASLPDDLADQYRHVHEVVGAAPYLLDLTNLDVPTVMAYLPPGHGRSKHARGLGTSLSESHAVYRALAELLQIEALDGVASPEQVSHLEQVDPSLGLCARFDLSPVLAESVSRPIRPAYPVGSVAEQLTEVSHRVRAGGYVPYYREINTSSDGLSTVHVFVPGLEQIRALVIGQPALPGPRGLDAARRGAAARS